MSFYSFVSTNQNNLIALAIILLILFFVLKNRRKFAFEQASFIYRTKLGLKLMGRMAKRKLLVSIYSTLGVIVAVLTVPFFLYLIAGYFQLAITSPKSAPAAAGLVLPFTGVPYVIGVPVFYWLIALVFVVVVHEMSHGVVALAKRIKLKSSGFGFFLGFLPLAFVEPDEGYFEKARSIDKLRVLSVGSFTNIVFAVIFFLLYIYLSHYAVASGLVSFAPLLLHIVSVVPGSPAALAGMPAGTNISTINGATFTSEPTILSYIENLSPNVPLNFTSTSGAVYTITPAYNASRNTTTHSYLGIEASLIAPNEQKTLIPIISSTALPAGNLPAQSVFWVDGLLLWLFIISSGLGIVNLLPVFYITDGCKIFYELVGLGFKNKALRLKITNAIIIAFSILFVLLIIPPSLWL